MSRSKQKKPRAAAKKRWIESHRKSLGIAAALIALAAAATFIWGDRLLDPLRSSSPPKPLAPSSPLSEAPKADFERLVGDWLRPDGGYVISIRGIGPDGKADATYLNPRPIKVSRAEVTTSGSAVKLFVELRDIGYPGSTYELVYNPSDDSLAGIYFQAALGQRFDVVFIRKK
jgi:hypothetical protein